MNTHFKSALSKIVAEDELVEKTEKYLRAQLENPNQGKILYFKRSVKQMKKFLIASAAAVVVIGASIGGYMYLKTPVAYISLDINPSVELGVNALNDVVSAEGVNEDGQTILEEQDVVNTDVTDALDQLIGSAAEKEFIKDDGTTVISITAESNNEDKAANLTNISEQAVNNSMSLNKVTGIVYKDCSDLSLRTEAKDLGVSPGKLKLIKSLQALDSSITVDQFKDAKVSEIMLKAHELMSTLDTDNNASEISENKREAIEKLKDVAQKAEERAKNAVNTQFEATKEQAKATFEEAKNQAETIRNDAKTKAEDLRDQAAALIKSTKGMTETEKEAVIAQAEELKKQAETAMEDAASQAEEIKNTAEKQKDEAIKAAEELKETAKSNDNTDESQIDQENKGEETKVEAGKDNENKADSGKNNNSSKAEVDNGKKDINANKSGKTK